MKITWFLDGFVHMTYESVDGKEMCLESVLRISRALCPFVAPEMLARGSSPPLESLRTFQYLYEDSLTFWHIFYFGPKLALNLVIFCQMPELILKTNNLLKPCFVGV